MTLCTACGFDNPPAFAFCGHCGELASRGGAQRRQLTVLFCDVVDSARLAEHLDPEDLREVLRAYHDVAGAVLERFGGHTAQVLGDGLLVYFGYPTAHEDDARRAILSALAILDEVRALDERLQRKHGLPFAVRFGVHTGPVVAGDVAVGESRENLAVGQTPNIAARLQSLARPNTVLLSGDTHRLVQGFFESEPLGPRTLKGISQPIDVHRVIGQRDIVNPFERVSHDALTPMVGRDAELTTLVDRFAQAAGGAGCAVGIVGEPGLGKSRLLYQFREIISSRPHQLLACYGSPFHQGTALFPLIRVAGTVLGISAATPLAEKYDILETAAARFALPVDGAVPLLAKLFSIRPTPRFPESTLAPQRQKERTFECLLAMIRHLAAEQPVVFIVEDLQFVDASTFELVDRLLGDIASWPVLVLLTARPGAERGWIDHPAVTPITLKRLSLPDTRLLITRVARDRQLPEETCRRLAQKADGVPLFGEELTKAVLEADLAAGDPHSGQAPEVPNTLKASLTARLDRLGGAREVAELAAVVGREFTYKLLSAVYSGGESRLRHALSELERAEIIFARGQPPRAEYIFKHALVQDAAYDLLLKSARRTHHEAIAQALTARFPDLAEEQPELVAHHYSAAGQPVPAIAYWIRAGDRAWERSANQEGEQSVRRALALVADLPEPDRASHELRVQLALGRILVPLKGPADPEVGDVYQRAFELCEQLGDADQAFTAADGLHAFYLLKGFMPRAFEFGDRLLHRAEATGDPAFLAEAHYKVGANYYFAGQPVLGNAHLERAVALLTPDIARRISAPNNAAAQARPLAGAAQWVLGRQDAARASSLDGIAVARGLAHPQSLVGGLVLSGSGVFLRRGDYAELQAHLSEALPLCEAHGFRWWQAIAMLFGSYGTCVLAAGRDDAAAVASAAQGILVMKGTIAALHAGGADIGRPEHLAYLADALIHLGRQAEARAPIEDALAFASESGQRYHDAELHRLAGEALLPGDPAAQAEAERHFLTAIDVARQQEALSFELRAAVSLMNLLKTSPRRAEARDRLNAVYSRFTEGFESRDLRAARALLAE